MTAFLLVVGLGCSLALVLLRRGRAGHEVTDRRRIARQVLALDTGSGLVASPPVLGPGTLDGTAWTVLLQRLLGREVLRPQPAAVAELAAVEPPGPWRDLYLALVGSVTRPSGGLPAPSPTSVRLSAVGGDQVQVADDALALWAEVQANGLRDQRPQVRYAAVRWARSVVRACRANAFVVAHLVDVLAVMTPPGDVPPTTRCPGQDPPRPIGRPADEKQLLTLVGDALAAEREGSATRSAELRTALAPTVEMTYDSWWAYYAARGYVAAGGSARAFDHTLDGLLRTADAHGLVPTATQPASTLETTRLAVEVLSAAGAEAPTHLRHEVTALPRTAGQTWTDADWAQWGLLVHALAVAPSSADRSSVVRAAGRCAAQEPSPATARTVGMCRAAVRGFGGEPPRSVDWTRWRGAPAAALVSAAASLEASPPDDDLRGAIAALGSDLGVVPTSVLADLSAVQSRADLPRDPTLERRVRRELATRRGPVPFDGLFTEARGDRAPTYYSTLAVLSMENRSR